MALPRIPDNLFLDFFRMNSGLEARPIPDPSMRCHSFKAVLASITLLAALELHAQRPVLSAAVRTYVAVDSPIVALTHARVIDGTGAAAREDQTVVIRDGRIAALGASRSISVPGGAQVIDLTGKTVIPGLVMVHEHLYYPTRPGVYANLAESVTRLYLEGGVTTMRTGGNQKDI